MTGLLALVDCNNFYVSCERVFAPKLCNKPVIVLSNNDGCAVARSNEAKALGIAMGAPWHLHREAWAKQGVIVRSSNYALYGDMSRRVMSILRRFNPKMEVYSIDEAFLDLSGLTGNGETFARELRATVLTWTGIPVSIGIAPTKTLAKVANRAAKKDPASGGVRALTSGTSKRPRWASLLDIRELSEAVASFTSRAAEKLRRQHREIVLAQKAVGGCGHQGVTPAEYDMGRLYGCIQGRAQTVKLFINEDPLRPGAVLDVKVMWNAWKPGTHREGADQREALAMARGIVRAYGPGLEGQVLDAFRGQENKVFWSGNHWFEYRWTPGPGINEHLLV